MMFICISYIDAFINRNILQVYSRILELYFKNALYYFYF